MDGWLVGWMDLWDSWSIEHLTVLIIASVKDFEQNMCSLTSIPVVASIIVGIAISLVSFWVALAHFLVLVIIELAVRRTGHTYIPA